MFQPQFNNIRNTRTHNFFFFFHPLSDFEISKLIFSHFLELLNFSFFSEFGNSGIPFYWIPILPGENSKLQPLRIPFYWDPIWSGIHCIVWSLVATRWRCSNMHRDPRKQSSRFIEHCFRPCCCHWAWREGFLENFGPICDSWISDLFCRINRAKEQTFRFLTAKIINGKSVFGVLTDNGWL